MRPRSLKRAKQERLYNMMRVEFLAAHPRCEFPGCTQPSSLIHHAKGRDGDLLCDAEFFRALCDPHHRHVHANPAESYESGLLVRRHGAA